MTRLLTIFMIFTLLIANGSSVAAAVCHHQNADEHVLALKSHDRKIAAVSLAEDAAAAVASKKGSQSSGSSVHWPAEMLPAGIATEPTRSIERIRLRPADQAALPSASIPPLLKPPSA